jgi:hypothetical protein
MVPELFTVPVGEILSVVLTEIRQPWLTVKAPFIINSSAERGTGGIPELDPVLLDIPSFIFDTAAASIRSK